MTALEIRSDEIGAYDPARARALRAKLWGAVIQPKPVVIPIKQEPATRTIYSFPIGPRQEMVASAPVGWVRYGKDPNFLRRVRFHARRIRHEHPLDCHLYTFPIGPLLPLRVVKQKGIGQGRDLLRIESETNPFRVKEILAEVMASHGIGKDDFFSRRRFSAIVNCRHNACYRLRHETNLSLPGIARATGLKDHTSARYGIIRWTKLLEVGEVVL